MPHIKLTEEFIQKACSLLEEGNYVCIVCDYMNVTEPTWYKWIKFGKEAESKKADNKKLDETDKLCLKFLRETKKAQAKAVARNITIIQKAAPDDWKAAAWFLERTKADLYGSKQNIVVSDDTEALDVEKVREKLAELKANSEAKE